MRFLADENFDGRLLRGMLRREPTWMLFEPLMRDFREPMIHRY